MSYWRLMPFKLVCSFKVLYTNSMKNKNTIKNLITLMEDKGENPHFIIGWLSSMIDQSVSDKSHSMQESIDNGIRYFQNKK